MQIAGDLYIVTVWCNNAVSLHCVMIVFIIKRNMAAYKCISLLKPCALTQSNFFLLLLICVFFIEKTHKLIIKKKICNCNEEQLKKLQ